MFPCCYPITIRFILSLAAFHWFIRQLDVKMLFLHGHLTKEVHMKWPHGLLILTTPIMFAGSRKLYAV